MIWWIGFVRNPRNSIASKKLFQQSFFPTFTHDVKRIMFRLNVNQEIRGKEFKATGNKSHSISNHWFLYYVVKKPNEEKIWSTFFERVINLWGVLSTVSKRISHFFPPYHIEMDSSMLRTIHVRIFEVRNVENEKKINIMLLTYKSSINKKFVES